MDCPFAQYHKHGAEGASSGVARVGEASEGEKPIVPRKVLPEGAADKQLLSKEPELRAVFGHSFGRPERGVRRRPQLLRQLSLGAVRRRGHRGVSDVRQGDP